jgi:hypothetical protein
MRTLALLLLLVGCQPLALARPFDPDRAILDGVHSCLEGGGAVVCLPGHDLPDAGAEAASITQMTHGLGYTP